MKLISWNVNGFRKCMNNGGFEELLKNVNTDFLCIQEIKCNEKIEIKNLENYLQFWNFPKMKKGYSGTAIFSKKEPIKVVYGIKDEYGDDLDDEGRIITLEYPEFYLVNCYIPNSKMKRERLNYRLEFNEFFIDYIEKLNFKKDVIVCGDFNVAYQKKDICKDFRSKFIEDIIFSDDERKSFEELLNIGLIDTFRYYHPEEQKYSWWFDNKSRKENIGWRLDYFLVSDELKKYIKKAEIHNEISGSDHCPIELQLELEE